MSTFKVKAELSISAAEVLQRAAHFNSVPHCAYYSCLLCLKHQLLKQRGCTELELDKEVDKNGDKSTHVYIIDTTLDYIKNYRERRALRNRVSDLKKARTESDYSCALPIDAGKSQSIIDEVKSLNRAILSI